MQSPWGSTLFLSGNFNLVLQCFWW